MLTQTQDDTYFERMASSIGDKARLLPLTEGTRVLDVGAGGGEFAELERLRGAHVTALDGSRVAIGRILERFPKVDVLQVDAHRIGDHYDHEFDTVVCSSLMHEVYSYGIGGQTAPYSLTAVNMVLDSIAEAVKPGGVLLIRDGVMPDEWNKRVVIKLVPGTAGDVLGFFLYYAGMAPFFNTSREPGTVHLTLGDDGLSLVGNLASAMEFLYTYTWGWEPVDREARELYGVFTQADYTRVLAGHGFTVESSVQYVQPGYVEYLSTRARIVDESGVPVEWPSTNMIVKARRN